MSKSVGRYVVSGSWYILLMLFLTSCSGSVSESEAEEAIHDVFAGNVEEANEVLCSAQQLDPNTIPSLTHVALNEVTCSLAENSLTMVCSYVVASDAGETQMQTNFVIDEDGKLCSPLNVPIASSNQTSPQSEATPEQLEATLPPDGGVVETPEPGG